MYHNRFFVHCLICGCILVSGLGLALVLPWLANAQGFAAKSEAAAKPNTPEAPDRYYVAKTGNGTAPQHRLEYGFYQCAACPGRQRLESDQSEIWVAAGVYYTDKGFGQTDNESNSTFELTDRVALSGELDTGDKKLSDRDWETNLTVLSGDIYGRMSPQHGRRGDEPGDIIGENAYHVVWANGAKGTQVTEYTVIDGFRITAGDADTVLSRTMPTEADSSAMAPGTQ